MRWPPYWDNARAGGGLQQWDLFKQHTNPIQKIKLSACGKPGDILSPRVAMTVADAWDSIRGPSYAVGTRQFTAKGLAKLHVGFFHV